MKKNLRLPLALLALLSLIGGGLVVRTKMATEAKHRAAGSAPMSDDSPAGHARSKSQRIENGDAERLAKIHGWLMETEDKRVERREWTEMQAAVNGLSLDAIKELLADPEGLADEVTGFIDDAWPIHTYPQRFDVRLLIWQRFAELAPDEALALAFPEGKPSKDAHIQIEDILLGVAKGDSMRAFGALSSHYSQSGPFDEVSRTLSTEMALQLAEECAETHPAEVAVKLGELGEAMRPYAYRGYASSLGEGTDWAAEVSRLEELFPDPAQRHFSSQHPTASLVTSWAKSDPAAAFAWMESLEKNDDLTLTGMGYMEVVAMWMREQPTASVDFLKDREFQGIDPDGLYSRILSGYGGMSQEVAQGALELIGDQATRDAAALDLIKESSTNQEVLRRLEISNRVSGEVREAAAQALARQARPEDNAGH